MVEINLTSNDVILGIKPAKEHPLATPTWPRMSPSRSLRTTKACQPH
jgi:hypothetical protein